MIATAAKPILWPRCDQETWSLTPPNRYVLNAEYADKFNEDQLESVSDLKGGAFYRPFNGDLVLDEAKILVERHRSRGIGDLLFMTGPLAFLHHMSGGTAKFYVKSLVDRGTILANHPCLHLQTALYGPTLYDTLPLYRYHWFVESVTEFNEDHDQPNVYDVLFRQIGLNPDHIDKKFKRPTVGFSEADLRGLHVFYQAVWSERKIDLRCTPYYVVAPFSHGEVRMASLKLWLNLIHELSKVNPVIVVGSTRTAIPDSDISAGEFVNVMKSMCRKSSNIINILGETPLRSILTIISKAKCVLSLDSAPLYMAQACRVPAVSLWGPHSPSVRLGYDVDYMDLAIHKTQACVNSPCFAYAGLPKTKCPQKDQQRWCSVLESITMEDVFEKITKLDK